MVTGITFGGALHVLGFVAIAFGIKLIFSGRSTNSKEEKVTRLKVDLFSIGKLGTKRLENRGIR